MQLYTINTGMFKLDGGAMFGNAPKTMWQQWITPDELNRIPIACRALLVETEQHRILFELGIGFFFEPLWRDRYGVQGSENMLLKNLQKIGVSEDSIDYIVISHLHFDHIGGLLPDWPAMQEEGWSLRFPRAKYLIGQEQWNHSLHPHKRDRASYISGVSQKLLASNRLVLVNQDQVDLPGLKGWLRFRYSEGHTPGLMLSVLKGATQTLVFCSDLIPGVPWVPTSISMGYDRYAEKCLDEKEELLKEAIANQYLLFYTHDAEFAMSKAALSIKGKYYGIGCVKELNGYDF